MHPGALRALEFDRIVSVVTGLAVTPTGAARLEDLRPLTDAGRVAAALRATSEGARFLADNPGFPLRGPSDLEAILDALGADRFATSGWSGGGPHALACAALLGDRVRAAATIAGVAPYDAEGLDWMAGMGEENVEDFHAAVQGREVYTKLLEQTLPPVFEATPEQLVSAFGGLVTDVDAAFVTRWEPEYLSRVFGRAGAQGIVGAREDGLSIVEPWGFDLDTITVPVAVWQGRHDAMVPFTHGEWLAANVAGAQAHLLDDEGHLSLFAQIDEILTDTKDLAGA